MYDPVKDGVKNTVHSVRYLEAKPPADLSRLVHSFWELKTDAVLAEDFYLHVLPDACVNLLFNLVDPRIAAVTARQTTYVALNLGKTFHYAGIQLLPGAWQGNRDEILDGFVNTPYAGSLPLVETGGRLAQVEFSEKQSVLADLVRRLIEKKLAAANEVVLRILKDIERIHTVADMAEKAKLSTRQLQRVIKQTTGFSPHDLLKVLRLQQSFRGHYLTSYADQAHFIHSFRKITGYTPAKYFKTFTV
jgi:AraC-like DNA-binding protein